MKNQRALSALYLSRTGRTTTKPPAMSGDVVRLFGYMPARTMIIKRWG